MAPLLGQAAEGSSASNLRNWLGGREDVAFPTAWALARESAGLSAQEAPWLRGLAHRSLKQWPGTTVRRTSPLLNRGVEGRGSLFPLGTQISFQEEVRGTWLRNQVTGKPQPFIL